MPKIYSLQVFRAVAALLVVLFHTTHFADEHFGYTFLGGTFAFGHIGVDFFFVLSGFIILYLYLDKIGDRQNVWPYLYKRVSRIFPIYWIITTVKVVLIFLVPTLAKAHEQDVGFIARSYLLIPQQTLPLIGVSWTLSYEVFFYLLFALALVLPIRVSLYLTGCWIVAIVVFWGGVAFNQSTPDNQTQFLLNERNLEFLLGCLGAYLFRRQWPMGVRYDLPILWFGCTFLILTSTLLIRWGNVPTYFIFFGVPSFLIILGGSFAENRRGNFLPPIFVLLGQASYSIYLTHVMFMNAYILIGSRIGIFDLAGMFVSTCVMVIFSVLGGLGVYLLIERPIIKHLRIKRVSDYERSIDAKRISQTQLRQSTVNPIID